jgi:hypothetical protein
MDKTHARKNLTRLFLHRKHSTDSKKMCDSSIIDILLSHNFNADVIHLTKIKGGFSMSEAPEIENACDDVKQALACYISGFLKTHPLGIRERFMGENKYHRFVIIRVGKDNYVFSFKSIPCPPSAPL